MKFTLYQVDAFTNKVFGGNPAAVMPLDAWIDDALMQQLALENNLSETVFFVPREGRDSFDIRWFTPLVEINLCGHATLASAFVLYKFLGFSGARIEFHSKSGPLSVQKHDELFALDFPAWAPERVHTYPGNIRQALGVNEILGFYKQRDLLVEVASEKDVLDAKPDFGAIRKWGEKVILTAPGSGDVDFVSRFFAPSAGIDEDPVTGSAHSQLIPFWSARLGKTAMHARQLSKRGGELWVEHRGNRVVIAGQCAFFMKGEVEIHNGF